MYTQYQLNPGPHSGGSRMAVPHLGNFSKILCRINAFVCKIFTWYIKSIQSLRVRGRPPLTPN